LSSPAINSAPKDSATVILVRRAHGKTLEVFLARRHVRQSFMAGAFVFPGGKLEAADADFALTKLILAKEDFHPHSLLQDNTLTKKTALSFFICAIRETFEETGVLFARTKSGHSIDFGNAIIKSRFAAYRQSLNLGNITLTEIARQEELILMPALLIPYSHWITPEIVPKRFSTRFFLAELPVNQTATTDRDELTSSLWVTPHDALQMHIAGKITLMPPTLKTIEEMAKFISVYTLSLSKDNEAARRRLRRRINNTLRKPTTQACAGQDLPTKLAKESEGVLDKLFAAARNRSIYPIMPQPMKNGLMLPHDPEYSIERYKQPVRSGEHSRFLITEGKWQCAEFPDE
jgi:8-oxo-dGTP pyrophosphatase MutT (NUDIX family)